MGTPWGVCGVNQGHESKLSDLPNIGSGLAQELEMAGIDTVAALRSMGSVAAAAALKAHGFELCCSKLWALEGAIQGIRWHGLPVNDRTALWNAYQALEG